MLHELLSLKRPLFVFDVESTGTNPLNDRIVEIGFQMWTPTGIEKEWRTIVNPLIGIPASASAVHSITDGVVRGCRECGQPQEGHAAEHDFKAWPTFKQLATNLARGFSDCDFAGKRVRFDLRITAAEMQRSGIQWSYAGARIIDIDRFEHIVEPRSLSDLYRKYLGEELADAHGALVDVRASTAIIQCQLKIHDQLPRDLDAIHALLWPGWIDVEGYFKFVDGVAHMGGWGKHANVPMKDVPIGYWHFITNGTFSPEVKAIAEAAKQGKFPEPTP
jgi:DNA polymerase-3 subunit epsilon